MMENKNRKAIASFELIVIIVSVFAFAHLMAVNEEIFEKYEKVEFNGLNGNVQMRSSMVEIVLGVIFEKLRKPMVSMVSAIDINNNNIEDSVECEGLSSSECYELLTTYQLIEDEKRTTYSISSSATDVGCCFIAKDGQKCGTASPDNCVADSPFAEGALCSQTSFCQKGCCYNEALGIFDKNVLKADCLVSWIADPNCNMPAAKLGCCILGTTSIFETEGQCEVDTLSRALGENAVVDWQSNVGEGECLLMSATQVEGACILAGGVCKFGTEHDCYSYDGKFNEGYLCTSSLLDSSCEMTEQTTCVEGKDGVYFVDSCGNVANIYDLARVNDQSYWEVIVEPENLCGHDDADGNADSKDCGNCNRFLGGICASATENNFDVGVGSFYCKDTSCLFDGVKYKNGESWCVYDGAIGDGNDVVGSRHWKYVCSQGVTQIEPCADYRNQICIQTNTFDVNGTEVEFRNSACVANNWRECIDLNSEEDGIEECVDTLNCRVEKVEIADKFKFDVCLPKYPGGFSLKDERYMMTAEKICGMADQTCTVVYAPKTWGGCKLVANGGCLGEKFAQEMNDFCRGLGDCGGSVNILGEYTDNYKVTNSPKLSQDWINKLKVLAEPVPGQFAKVEDYSEYLEAAGLWANPGETPAGEAAGPIVDFQNIGMGTAGIGFAVGMTLTGYTALGIPTLGLVGSGASAIIAPFASAAIGAGIGMVAGVMIAKQLGLSPGGTMLMAIGGAIAGGAIGYGLIAGWGTPVLLGMGPVGWIALAGIVIMVIASFFMGDDCPPTEVMFECKPWKAPTGGDDCELCNNDPLKPCSEYRCNSLGAACELVNKGTEQEMCASSKDDGSAPILKPQFDVISESESYSDVSDDGFRLTSITGGCIDAYTPLIFGITTNELAYCKFDTEITEFENMDYDFGGNSYLYNHTTVFSLPDPSHGQSQGVNWTGDLTLYIKCVDTHGHESSSFYTVDMCVNEGPDRMAPRVVATDPLNDAIVGFDVSSKNISVVTNEFATCKWDLVDVDYSLMSNEMSCEDSFGLPSSPLGYLCKDNFPTLNTTNVYYIRCADQPWLNDSSERNANTESFVWTLRKPEKMIEIDWIEPSRDFESATEMTTIELQVQTSGGGEWHYCSYSFSGYDRMIEMFETGADRIHSQLLNRPTETHKIYVECRDETGDSVQSWTEFEIIKNEIEIEIEPIEDFVSGSEETIVNLLVRTSGGGNEHNCSYSLSAGGVSVEFEEQGNVGVHEQEVAVAVGSQTIYVKCWDEAGNLAEGDILFEVTLDSSTPQVARIWQSNKKLYVVTVGDAECRYSTTSCEFSWEDGELAGSGKEHIISAIRGQTYYIKCEDEFGNAPLGCSVEVRVL